VGLIVEPGPLEAGRGIAVLAAELAGFVHADVPAGDAAARLALMGVFLMGTSRPKRRWMRSSSMHLPADAVGSQIHPLRATGDLHALAAARRARLSTNSPTSSAGCHPSRSTRCLLRQLAQTFGELAVDVHQANDGAVSVSLKRPAMRP